MPLRPSCTETSRRLWRNKGARRWWLLFGGLLAFAGSVPAQAAEPSLDERPCRSRDAYCQGYVAGILDSLRIAGSVCLPEAVPPLRVEFIVRDWLALYPTLLSQAGAELIANALRKSFPCK